jgi:hypothetical protein
MSSLNKLSNYETKIAKREIVLHTGFELESYKLLTDLYFRLSSLEYKAKDSISCDLLNVILKTSNDFDDFKIKYNKYLKVKNNNSKMEKFFTEDLGLNNLQPNNRVVSKRNGKLGTILAGERNSSNNNNIVHVKFNNNNLPVKRSVFNLKKFKNLENVE